MLIYYPGEARILCDLTIVSGSGLNLTPPTEAHIV